MRLLFGFYFLKSILRGRALRTRTLQIVYAPMPERANACSLQGTGSGKALGLLERAPPRGPASVAAAA